MEENLYKAGSAFSELMEATRIIGDLKDISTSEDMDAKLGRLEKCLSPAMEFLATYFYAGAIGDETQTE